MRTYGDQYYAGAGASTPARLIDGGSWTVPSDTEPGVEWTVTRTADGHWGCDCPGCRYQARKDGLCKHIDRVQGWLAKDPEAAEAAAVVS